MDINYYFRDYFGTIPDDAVSAGDNTFIAKAFAVRSPYFGELPTSIHSGDSSVKLSIGGNYEVAKPIQASE